MWRSKLGLPDTPSSATSADKLWSELQSLMAKTKADYILMFRQLAVVAELPDNADDEALLAALGDVFYQPMVEGVKKEVASWLREWRKAAASEEGGLAAAASAVRAANPKYVPREWMLVQVRMQRPSSTAASILLFGHRGIVLS